MKSLYLLFIFISTSLYTNSFADWQLQNPKFTGSIYTCEWTNSNTAFLSGRTRTLVKTTDAGTTWHLKRNGIANDNFTNSIYLLNFINENTGYVIANHIYKTVNAGETWTAISDKNFLGRPSVPDNGIIYGFTAYGNTNLIKSSNDGLTWSVLKENIELNYAYVKFLDAQTGFYTNSPSVNQKTTDGGNTWIDVNISQTGTLLNLNDISFANENTGYALMGGRIFKTIDKGLNWIQIYNQNTVDDLNIISENVIVAQTGGQFSPKMMKSYDGGVMWSETALPEYMTLKFYNESKGFGFYGDGTVYKITGLQNIENISSNFSMTSDMVRIQAVSRQKALALSSDGKFFSTQNNGTQWDRISTGITLKDFKFYNENSAVGSTANNIVTSNDGGVSWQIKSPCLNAKNFELVDENNFYFLNKEGADSYVRSTNDAGITNNSVFHSYDRNNGDNGISYKLREINFINSSTGFFLMNEFSWWRLGSSNTCLIWKTTNSGANWDAIYTLPNAIGEVFYIEGNTAYLSTDRGLFKSNDLCQTWTSISNMPFFTSLKFFNNLTGFAAQNGNIYKTINGGQNWILQQDGGTVKQIEMFDVNTGYAAGNAGTIYYTDNGGSVGVTPVSSIVNNYSLSQNYPNPFNPATKINFSIPKNGLVQIKVYDLMGREVQTLVNEFKTTGEYAVDFNGSSLSSGVYFYKLITNDFVETKKMMLVK